MKKIQNNKINFFKKIVIKLIRKLGFEVIDQQNYLLNNDTKLDKSHSLPGEKSIVIPLGSIKIKKKITDLIVIFRSCTSTNIMDQNKKRIFEFKKNEYTFRSLNSILKSIKKAKKKFIDTNFSIYVTDGGSSKEDLIYIKKILNIYPEIHSKLIIVNQNNFKNKIVGNYSPAKFSNMSNFYHSLELSKNTAKDLVYFVEDDYVHEELAIEEMLLSYEKFYTIFNEEVILLPADYPYLYSKNENTQIIFGNQRHWRKVNESLVTFLTSSKIVNEYWTELIKMASEWTDPWEKTLHEIYTKKNCLSPIPSLSMHCANSNSIFGIPPNYNWGKNWDENKIEI